MYNGNFTSLIPGTVGSGLRMSDITCSILALGWVQFVRLLTVLTKTFACHQTVSVYIHLHVLNGGFRFGISKGSQLSPLLDHFSCLPHIQSSVLFAASLRVMILYTLSLKLLSEVSRRAVSLSSSMLPSSALATANDLECFTAGTQ